MKVSKRTIAILATSALLLVLIGVSAIGLMPHAKDIYTGLYVGRAVDIDTDDLKYLTNTYDIGSYTEENWERNDKQIMRDSAPQITVLTPGLNQDASTFSNRNENNDEIKSNTSELYRFAPDSESMLQALIEKAGEANVYWGYFTDRDNGKEDKIEEFKLIDLNEQKDVSRYNKEDEAETVERIDDISKHIIVVFDPGNNAASNQAVYERLDYMLDKLIYDVAYLNDGYLPKINLIGHSRGGLTNLQYALEHPDIVASLVSFGTPYFGSNPATILQLITNSTGLESILDSSIQRSYVEAWNNNYSKRYSNINVQVIAGTSDTAQLYSAGLSALLSGDYLGFGPFLASGMLKASARVKVTIEALNVLVNLFYKKVNVGKDIRMSYDDDLMSSIYNFLCSSEFEGVANYLISNATVYDDFAVHLPSAWGIDGAYYGATPNIPATEYEGFSRHFKKFTLNNSNFDKKANGQPGVAHNLEPYDRELINYAMDRIEVGAVEFEYYSVEQLGEGEVAVSGYHTSKSKVEELEIPSEIEGKVVTSIGYSAFSSLGERGLSKVVIPNTVELIEKGAFYGIESLKEVVFEHGSNIVSIDEGAFGESGLEIMYEEAGNQEADINLPESLIVLKESVFEGTSIESIYIGSRVEKLVEGAFRGIEGLRGIALSEDNNNYKLESGGLYELSSNSLVLWTGEEVARLASGTRRIGDYAFMGSEITSIDLLNIREIGKGAFAGVESLSNITNDQTIEEVGEYGLDGTAWLDNQTGEGINTLGRVVVRYNDDGSESLSIGSEYSSIYAHTFEYNESLKSVSINVKYIGDYAFNGSSLRAVSLGENVEVLGTSVFGLSEELTELTSYSLYPPSVQGNVLDDYDNGLVINVPSLSQSYYKEASGWDMLEQYISSKQVTVHLVEETSESILEVEYYSFLPALPSSVKDGYVFDGWYSTSGDSYIKEYSKGSILDIASNDVYLYAKYQAVYYIINYEVDWKADNSANPLYYTTDKDTRLYSPVLEGSSFVGWYDNVDLIGEVVSYIEAGSQGDITLYAKWEDNVYLVNYDVNTTDKVTLNNSSTEVRMNSAFMLEVPLREGYEFDGWYDINGKQYTTSSGQGLFDWNESNDKTLFAKWIIKEFYIELDIDGSVRWLGSEGVSDDVTSIEYGRSFEGMVELILSLQDSSNIKSGYKFRSFLDVSGKVINGNERVEDYGESGTVIKLIADFVVEEHVIYFDYNGGEGITMNSIVGNYSSNISLPVPTKTGYNFAGWGVKVSNYGFSDTAFDYNIMPDLSPYTQQDASINLIAMWVAKEYTVQFDNNGYDLEPVKVSYESSYILPVASRTGYTFMGWYYQGVQLTDSAGNSIDIWTIQDSITVEGNWLAIRYEIVYVLNGGTMEGDYNTSYTIEDNFTLASASRRGYVFGGWTLNDVSIIAIEVGGYGDKTLIASYKGSLQTVYTGSNTLNSSTANEGVIILDLQNFSNGSTVTYFTIGSGVSQVQFLSVSTKTFSNMYISISSRSSNITLLLDNFVIVADGNNYGIYYTSGYVLTLDVLGGSSITGGSSTSGAGKDGIYATSATVNIIGSGALTVSGGTGYNGSDGSNGSNGSQPGQASSGKNGSTGGAGGNGGAGTSGYTGGYGIRSVYTTVSVKNLTVKGGNGGTGGKGGNGGNGGKGGKGGNGVLLGATAKDGGSGGAGGSGGNGGAGGAGGYGIYSTSSITIDSNTIFSVTGGNGGNGGLNGQGGTGGSGGEGGNKVLGGYANAGGSGANGAKGATGAGGTGGSYSNLTISASGTKQNGSNGNKPTQVDSIINTNELLLTDDKLAVTHNDKQLVA